MKRRLFIAINLPENIKKKLLNYQKEWADLPVRWTRESNIHITLVFIGHVGDEEMLEICKIVKEVASRHSPFNIDLGRIVLGPPDRPPRMVWVEGRPSKELAILRDGLENFLLDSKNSGYQKVESRSFRPHITLGRIKQWEWRKLSPQPKIEKEIALSFPVESIEVMQSDLKRDGAGYTILESVNLGE